MELLEENLSSLELDDVDVQCLCEIWLGLMINLTRLVLDFENNLIGSEGGIILAQTLITLTELD